LLYSVDRIFKENSGKRLSINFHFRAPERNFLAWLPDTHG
jgi:hypothetical protein